MKLDNYIKYDLEKTFNIKIDREVFSKKVISLEKIKIDKEKGVAKFLIPSLKDLDYKKTIKLNKIFPYILGYKPDLLDGKILLVPQIYEEELKFINLFNVSLVITQRVLVNSPLKMFYTPILETKNIKNLNLEEVVFKEKSFEINGTNLFFDIGYGSYYFFVILPYDSKTQSINNLSFYGSYKVIKELIRRSLQISSPKGYRIRFLFSDLTYYNNAGLIEHIKNINTEKVLGILNVQNSGLGNEKIVIKNYRYLIDKYTENKIDNILSKIGESVNKIPMKEYTNVDLIIQNSPIIWFYSYPNVHKNKLHYSFLSKDKIKKTAYILFSILKNIYREF